MAGVEQHGVCAAFQPKTLGFIITNHSVILGFIAGGSVLFTLKAGNAAGPADFYYLQLFI